MSDEFQKPPRSWYARFRDAFRGVGQGARGQSSFLVHFVCAAMVLLLGSILRMNWIEGSLLVICIFAVLTAEMFNSALETLAKAIDTHHNPHLADGLNIASSAVLLGSIGAVIVGTLVFTGRLIQLLNKGN
ncbi:MAG: diacylglycerol kinase [Pirellulaceae bacterium]